ncbi:MAG: T9SS type A sorting domain-containing protein [Bacteroidetes bacterium]|nr:MAG: T9SS type A sorting domain-containing protein [Bacteroidota bacterium]
MKIISILLLVFFALAEKPKTQETNSHDKRSVPLRKSIIKFIVFVTLLLNIITSNAEEPDILWQKCLGGSNGDNATSIQKTSDGGYIVGGYTTSNNGDVSGNHGNTDIWVVKLNSNRVIQWQKCLGGSGNEYVESDKSILETSDGGYILAGRTYSNNGDVSGNHGGQDYWIVKLNSSGVIQWQKCLGGTGNEELYSIQINSDNGYIVAGLAFSNDGDVSGNHGLADYWVVKLNSSGVILWQKSLGGTGSDQGNYINNTSDGGFIVAGQTASNDGDVSGKHGGYDYWIVKLNSSGNILWQKCLGGNNEEWYPSVLESSDGGFIITGYTTSNDGDVSGNHGQNDYWVVKLNSSGSIQWQKCLGGSYDDYAESIIQTSDEGYIIVGYTYSNDGDVSGNHGGGKYDAWVVKINNSDVIQWQKCLGGSDYDGIYSIKETINDEYILAGWTYSNDGDVSGVNGSYDFWIVKLTLNSISTGTISPLSLCQKATVSVPFTATGTFNAGNTFTAQLSNATASFAAATTIGTLSSTNSGSINCTIPTNTPPGNGYRIRVVSSNPSIDGSDNGTNITINALPVPLIVGPDTVCAENKYIYTCTAPGSTGSQWKVINGKFEGPSTGNSVEIEWDNKSSGTITLIQTTSSNCIDSANLVVTINPLPHPVITTSDTILCVGKTGLYQSNTQAGILYKWVVNRGIIIGPEDAPTLTVRWDTAGTGFVRLIQTYSGTGCKDSTKKDIVISPLPQPKITSNDTILCINTSGSYSTDVDVNLIYKWIATGGVIQGQDNTSSVTVLWNVSGTNKIKLIQTYPLTGCKDSTEKTIIINPLPSTQITGNDFTTLNTTEQYSAYSPADIDNLWSVNNGTIQGLTTDSILSVKWESVGTGRVMLRQTNTFTNCINYDTMLVTITESIPPLIVDAGQDKAICKGESIQIGNTNPASGGVQPYRYKWSPSQGLNNDTLPNPNAKPDITTLYTLTVTDSRDSTATDNVSVTVNPLPVPQITGNTNVLLNNEEIYTAITPAGTNNTWSVVNGTQIGINNADTYHVKWDLLGSGRVTLEQKINATGCEDVKSLDVNISASIPKLTVDAGPDKEICMNDSVQLSSTNPASGGQPPYKYLWTPSFGLSNDTIPNPIANPDNSTQYLLTVWDSLDSTISDSVYVVVNPFPEALVRGNRNVLVNSIVTYSVYTPPGIESEWFVENGIQIGPNNDSTFRVQWNNPGTGKVISLQTITATGCKEADTIEITISQSVPVLIADAGADKSVCLGDTIHIGTVNAASGGVEPYKYKWSPSTGLSSDTIPYPETYPKTTTIYTITITDAQDSVSTDNMTITVNPLPTPQIIGNDKAMKSTTVSYSVSPVAGISNEWSVDNGTQIGSGKGTTFQVRWDSAGTGKVILEQKNIVTGCHFSDTLIVTVDAQQYAAMLGLPDMSAEPGGEIYMPVYLRDAELLANTNVTGIVADLVYNASLLEPIETTPKGTLSPDGNERTIPLRLGVNPLSDSTLQHLSFMAMLGNDTTTVLKLININSIGANVNIGAYRGTFTLRGICREGGARLVGSNGQVQLMLVRPNPAQEFAEVEYETTESGRTQLYLVNALGKTALSLIDGDIPKGRKVIRLNIDEIKSGTYFLILKTTTQVRSVRVDVVK